MRSRTGFRNSFFNLFRLFMTSRKAHKESALIRHPYFLLIYLSQNARYIRGLGYKSSLRYVFEQLQTLAWDRCYNYLGAKCNATVKINEWRWLQLLCAKTVSSSWSKQHQDTKNKCSISKHHCMAISLSLTDGKFSKYFLSGGADSWFSGEGHVVPRWAQKFSAFP